MGKQIAILNCILMLFLTSCLKTTEKTEDAQSLRLAENNMTDYVITVAPDDLVANTAAKELAEHLKAVTGADFQIASSESGKSSHVIAVGPAAAKKLAPELDLSYARLGHDGILLKSSGANLILTGAKDGKRGTLYSVYEFLENQVGVRWWTSKESFIPQKPSLSIPHLNKVYVPPFRSRGVFYKDVLENGIFATRCRSNGEWDNIPLQYGGRCDILGHAHTFYQLLPPEKYFKQHPEWYSEIKGNRVCKNKEVQLCLTNDEMRKELTKNALDWLRKKPNAEMISISQNDGNGGACQCKKCSAIFQREGAESGALVEFVNKVAEDIEKEFPKVYVDTLAYTYTQKPPLKIKPRKNVVIRLCSYHCSFSQPLATGAQNKAFKKDIEIWSSIASQLSIWDYVTNFANYIQPHPNLRVIAPNIRFFEKHKTIGLFEQGDAGSRCGDFIELRAWLLAHLMWNPALDEKILVKEFMDGYYGTASKPLREYLDIMHDAVESSGISLTCFNMTDSPWLDIDTMNNATKLFDEAEMSVKENPLLLKRVRKSRMALDYAWIKQYKLMKFIAKSEGKPFLGPADFQTFCKNFINTANDFNIGKFSETADFKKMEEKLLSKYPEASCPEICAGLPEKQWFDVQDRNLLTYELRDWIAAARNDPEASDKNAVKMLGTHSGWAVQYFIPRALQGYHCYAVIRCDIRDGASPKKNAFNIGIYYNTEQTKKNGLILSESVEHAADGKYHTYDLGISKLKAGNIWIAPDNNPDVNAVYVDRIFFVKQ